MPLRYILMLFLALAVSCDPSPTADESQATAPIAEAEAEAPQPDLRTRHSAMFKELRGMVKEMQESGRYDCCIQEPCSHCAMMVGGCSCGEGLRRGEPVCEECALMWIRGLGDEAGVDPKTVRSFLEAERIINAKAAKSAAAHGAHGAGHMKHSSKRKRARKKHKK